MISNQNKITELFKLFSYTYTLEEINQWSKLDFEKIELDDNKIYLFFKLKEYICFSNFNKFLTFIQKENLEIIFNYQTVNNLTFSFFQDLNHKLEINKLSQIKVVRDDKLFYVICSSKDEIEEFQKVLKNNFDNALLKNYTFNYFVNGEKFIQNNEESLVQPKINLNLVNKNEVSFPKEFSFQSSKNINNFETNNNKSQMSTSTFINKFTNPDIVKKFSKKEIFSNKKLDSEFKRKAPTNKTKIFEKIFDVLNNVHENEQFFLSSTVESYEIKTAKTWHIIQFYLNDGVDKMCFKKFFKEGTISKLFTKFKELKNGDYIVVDSIYRYDDYIKQNCGYLNDFNKLPKKPQSRKKNKDLFYHKSRPELSVHTNMSMMDGVSKIEEFLEHAEEYNLNALAITDINSVQSFPNAYHWKLKHKPKFKLIYGLQLNVIPRIPSIFVNKQITDFDFKNLKNYIIFDLETTGFYASVNEIIEFGAIKVIDGKIVDKLEIFLKPSVQVNEFISNLTGINNEMLKDAYLPKDGILKIKEFIKGFPLIAHNAHFDYSFLQSYFNKYLNINLENIVIDTYALARFILIDKKKFNLKFLAKCFKIKYKEREVNRAENNQLQESTAHRAGYDSEVLFNLFLELQKKLLENEFYNFSDICAINLSNLKNNKFLINYYQTTRGWPINIYVKNQEGIYKLYQILSLASTNYCFKRPKIFLDEINKYRQYFILTSSDYRSLVFDAVIQNNFSQFQQNSQYFDYLEINPPTSYQHFLGDNKFQSIDLLNEKILKTFLLWAKKVDKPVIVSSNCFYLNKDDYVVRDLLIVNHKNKSWSHYLRTADTSTISPTAHLCPSNELLKDFKFLANDELVHQIVFDNPIKLISQIQDNIIPIKNKLYPVIIEKDADNKIKEKCYQKLEQIYGKNVDKTIIDRLNEELRIIINNNYSNIFLISNLIVNKSLEDNYLVGSRGSIGSSFVGYLLNITEVNPLPVHYRCHVCKYHYFVDDETACGFDLVSKQCPKCGATLYGDGHNIYFETFLGIEGNKIPDIDLNFASSYQNKIHQYVVDLFSSDKVYRAGTISKIQEKLAYAYYMEYIENNPKASYKINNSEIIKRLTGIKKTSSQHPGGFIIVPNDKNIYEFTPICYPGDDNRADFKITHFDIDVIHDVLLKLDLLGHLDPEAISRINDSIGKKDILKNITFYDEKVLSLFWSSAALNYKRTDLIDEKTGAIGAPEFGTNFVRKMLVEGRPRNFSDLVRISGLSHGTNVWINNAKSLISKNKLKLKDVVACRDDILITLVNLKIDKHIAFQIMEAIRKGKGLSEDHEHILRQANIPSWYIESCKKITYLFPKAHATAYVMMAWRILWFKIYYPLEYYAVYFSIRCSHYEPDYLVLKDPLKIKKRFQELTSKSEKNLSAEEKDLIIGYESVLEMLARGYCFLQVDIYRSDEKNFKIDYQKHGLILPFSVIKGLGNVVASKLVQFRKDNKVVNYETLQEAKILNKTQLQAIKDLHIIK